MIGIAAVLALLSILNWAAFDILTLWQLSVLTREFGHWLFVVCILVMVFSWRRRRLMPRRRFHWTLIGAAIAAVGYARPTLSAMENAQEYRRELATFAERMQRPAEVPMLFSFADFWRSWWSPTVSFHRIEYRSPEGAELHADYYRAQGIRRPPLIVVVHGGGWEGGDTQQLPALNRDLSAEGYAVASVSYRFSPATPWPGQLKDVVAGIQELRRRADELDFDPERIVLLGRSAGAQIAGIVAYTETDLPIEGYVGFYGPTDLEFGFEVTVEGDIIDSRNILRRFLGGGPLEQPESYQSASLINALKIRPVPTLLLYGEPDRLVWYKHGERLKRRLDQIGIASALIVMPWGVHGFDFNPDGPGGQISRNAVRYFVPIVTATN